MIPVSTCSFIPSSQVIAASKMWLGISTTNYDGFFRIQIENCLQKFYSPALYKEQVAEVDICDNTIKIPTGWREVWAVAFCDDTESEEDTASIVSGGNFWMAQSLITQYPAYGNNIVENTFTIQNGHLCFTQETDRTVAKVWYRGFETDDNGLIVIPDYYEECLTRYLNYCFLCMPANASYVEGNPYVTKDFRNEHYQKYKAAKMQILGIEKKIEFDNQKHLLRFAQNKMKINDLNWWPFWGNNNWS